jgi:ferredoxin-NADP reductase/MOSC domain-containing protein YiiM
MSAGRLLSVNVGTPRDIRWRGSSVRTAIFKREVAGRRRVGTLNVDGDGQADLVGHGGEHRAVFVYQDESYRHWERELRRSDFVHGQFGENFTVAGLSDEEVCVGDRFAIGTALFEVTQPRVTCFKVGIRLEEPRMPSLLVAHGRPGFYLRVLREGEIGAGDEIHRVVAHPARVSVRHASALLYLPGHDEAGLERALSVAALSDGWRGSFRALLERGGDVGNPGLNPAGAAPHWPGFRPFTVAAVTRETAAVRSLVLEPVDGAPPAWEAGQSVALRLPAIDDGPAVVRSYSISRGPGSGPLRITVKREPGGLASGRLHALAVGDPLDVAAPRGSFTLAPTEDDGAPPLVLLSAGIGVTPVLAMLGALAAAGSGREVWWVHGARDRAEQALGEEASALLEGLPHAHTHVGYSRATGRIDLATLEALGVPRDADFYLCGPTGFLRDLTAALSERWGVPDAAVHLETFGADTIATGAEPHPPAGPPGDGPAVSFARSGLTVTWGPSYASLLELAEACDVPVRWSCRTGVCRSCESGLLDGAVDYAPDPLERPVDGRALLCCSRPRGRVTLDL